MVTKPKSPPTNPHKATRTVVTASPLPAGAWVSSSLNDASGDSTPTRPASLAAGRAATGNVPPELLTLADQGRHRRPPDRPPPPAPWRRSTGWPLDAAGVAADPQLALPLDHGDERRQAGGKQRADIDQQNCARTRYSPTSTPPRRPSEPPRSEQSRARSVAARNSRVNASTSS